MMKFLFILALSHAIFPPLSGTIPVHIRIAIPNGQAVGPNAVTDAVTYIQQATDWWMRNHPYHPQFVLGHVQTVVVPKPGDADWTKPFITTAGTDGSITVWVYLNHDPWYSFPGLSNGSGKNAFTIGRNAAVIADPHGLPWSTQANLAHEIGHAAFVLPDRYVVGQPCTLVDIMCQAETGYIQNTVGCQSLALLGAPCQSTTLYVPLLEAPDGQRN